MSDTENKKEFLLSTIDNPYDPFTHFDEWYQYDITHGSDYYGQPYDCLGLIARLAKTSDELSDYENAEEIDRTIKRIVRDDPIGRYCLKYKSSDETTE